MSWDPVKEAESKELSERDWEFTKRPLTMPMLRDLIRDELFRLGLIDEGQRDA